MAKRIRAVLAKLGLDVHNRGIITIGKKLMEENFEVIYIGNSLPNEIIQTAIQESVDIIGVSSLAGAHLTLGTPLINLAKREKIIDDITIVIGGVFSPLDASMLKTIGFDYVFTPGATGDEIIKILKNLVLIKEEQKCHTTTPKKNMRDTSLNTMRVSELTPMQQQVY